MTREAMFPWLEQIAYLRAKAGGGETWISSIEAFVCDLLPLDLLALGWEPSPERGGWTATGETLRRLAAEDSTRPFDRETALRAIHGMVASP